MTSKFDDACAEICHLACAALSASDPEVKRQALADIADEVRSVMPGEDVHGLHGLSAGSADNAEKTQSEYTAEFMRRKYSFCDGLFPIRRANSEKSVVENCWIGGRRFTMELSQDIHDDGEHVCCAKIRDKGNLIAKLVVWRGKSMAEHVAHAAFKAYVRNLSGSNSISSRGGFLKQNAKRKVEAAKAEPETATTAGCPALRPMPLSIPSGFDGTEEA